MEPLSRPVKNETDEDLLKQQEQFLKEQKRPSAQLVSDTKQKDEPMQSTSNDVSENKQPVVEDSCQNIEAEYDDIILEVQEHNFTFSEPFVFKPPTCNQDQINSAVQNMVDNKQFHAKQKSRSIFSQMVNSSKRGGDAVLPEKTVDSPVLIDGSGLVTGDQHSEAVKIHEENLAKLSAMSREEILHHQEQLKQFLKPEVLNFIRTKKGAKRSKKLSHEVSESFATISEHEKNDSHQILRKEGNKACDGLLLEKALNLEDKGSALKNDSANCVQRIENKELEIPPEVQHLVKSNEKGLWRNMNKIEKDKLQWMTDLPQPKPVDLKTGYTARFDFEGKLLEHTADIPTYKGLHHHGQEPEVPGYSLEELFLLARSSLQSQRITALNMIAHILENNWYGMMDNCFEAPLLPLLLNAGIVPLLRWAMDDTSLTSISATISAIHSLLISKADEACLQKIFCWPNGHIVPQLEPQDLDEPNIVIEELTDADLIKLDVVKGFLRIDIMPRFIYIFKVMCPPPLVCQLMIEICTRLAQHSPESAMQVADYNGFLKLIFEKFLPLSWNFVDSSTLTDTVNYSCPNHSAMKLIRIIASSGKEMAISLLQNFDLASVVTFYLTIQPVDGKLPAHEVQLLVIETLKIWHTYLSYGMLFSVFLDIFPIFLKQLDFCLSINLTEDTKVQIKDIDYATHLFKAFEAIAVVSSKQKDCAASIAVNVVFKKALVCLKKWLWQLSQEKTSTPQMCLIGSCMNFIVTYCKKSHEGLTCEDFEPCSSVKEVFEKFLVTTLKSNHFQNLLRELKSFSLLLCPEMTGNKRDGKTIVSLGSVLYGQDIVPILKDGTALPLLSAILNYIILYNSYFHNTNADVIDIIFCSHVTTYLKAVSGKEIKNSSWFLQFETYFIYQLTQLSIYVPMSLINSQELGVSVFPLFITSQESLLQDLFENIVFNQDEILKMSQSLHLVDSNEKNELSSVISTLPVIAECYSSCFLSKEAVQKSRSILFRNTDISALFQISTPSGLIDKDWCFKPIFNLYQKSKQRKGKEKLSPEEILQATCTLQWVYLCHILNLPVLREIPGSVEFYYLCMIFLIDEDFFRDEKVKSLLINCLSIIIKKKKFNESKIKWNGIDSFDDLYLELLTQYEAVSFGDETFGNFLLMLLQQNCPNHWKKVLLTEHSDILRFLRIPIAKTLVPIENFLLPVEMDVDLILMYLKALTIGTLNHVRCPVLHLMAVHHVNSFLFINSQDCVAAQKDLLSKILRAKKDLQRKVLLYLKVDETLESGFSMSKELSAVRSSHLSQIFGTPVTLELFM